MIIVITGGSGSGKSENAEKKVLELLDDNKYYLATMKVFGEEGQKKVERHKALRAGKGFQTLEFTEDIKRAGEIIKKDTGTKTLLLECISNLLANEMFRTDTSDIDSKDGAQADYITNDDGSKYDIVDKIIEDVIYISDKVDNLVIVTNNVFEDGVIYDSLTMEYIDKLGLINQRLFELADYAYESVVGIMDQIK